MTNKEKQIEELGFIIQENSPLSEISSQDLAEAILEDGYHKQSEWISVDDALPKSDTRVLVYMHENRMSYTKVDTDRMVARKWVRWGNLVTHWMPLPEAPKIKGGEG